MVTRRQELAQNRRRSPAGLTADPCPLCKKAAGDNYDDGLSVPFRIKDSVCSHCLKEIQDLRNSAHRLERMVSRGEIKNARPRRIYPFPNRFTGSLESREAVSAALRTLAKLVGGDCDENEWYRVTKVRDKESFLLEGEGMAATFYRSMTDEEHSAMQSLYEAIKENSESAYEEGRDRGKDILLSLQAGDIGLSEFDEKS
jgi:hypothetical protein